MWPTLAACVFALAIGVGGGIAWEDRPAGWPNVHFLFWHLGFGSGPLARWEADEARIKLAGARTQAVTQANAQAAATLGQTDAKVITQIHYITRTLVKEVPTYVTAQADASCTIPVGFVRLYNDDVSGASEPTDGPASTQPSPPTLGPDATSPANGGVLRSDQSAAMSAPSGLKLSQVLTTDLGNIDAAKANAQQVRDLQALYNGEKARLDALAAQH